MSDKTEKRLSFKTPDWKKAADARRTRGLIGTELLSLFEVYDDTPIAVHLVNIIRSKGKVVSHKDDGTPVYRDPYNIKDAELLKEIESYKNEIQKLKIDDEDDD